MIGGLALAGATADITDHPPSPKPTRGVPPQASGSSQGPQSGSCGVTADGVQELRIPAFGDNNAAAAPSGQGPYSEDPDQAGTSGGLQSSHAKQGNVAWAMGQPGTAPASGRAAALGQDNAALRQIDAALAAGPASGAAGMSDSTAAGAAAGSHMSPGSNSGTQVADSDEKGGYSSSNAAADSAAQDPTGSAAAGSQGAPAGPSSIAAYRPEGRAVLDGAWSGIGAGVGVDGHGQGGPTGLDLDESLRRQNIAGEKSHSSGGGDTDAGRRTKPSGQPVQVRVCLLMFRQAFCLVNAHAKSAMSLLCIQSHLCFWWLLSLQC